MEGAMSSAMTLCAPQEDVGALIQQVAEENGLEVMDQLKDLSVADTSLKARDEQRKEDDLSRSLQALRQWSSVNEFVMFD